MSQWTEEEREEALRRRMEGPLMAAQLSSATVMKFVSKGVVSADDTGPEKEEFIASESFDGSKPGYIFKVSLNRSQDIVGREIAILMLHNVRAFVVVRA